MSSSTPYDYIPVDIRGWKKLAKKWDVSGPIDQLGSPNPVRSASKFRFAHFLGLHVIYEFPKGGSRLPNTITAQFPSSGDSDLENLYGWTAYLDKIENFEKTKVTQSSAAPTCVPRSLGSFVNVWQFQQHVLLGDEVATDLSKISNVTPVGHRTRAQTWKRDPDLTPSRAPRSKKLPLSDTLARMFIDDDLKVGDPEKGKIEKEEDDPDDEIAKRLESEADEDDAADLEEATGDGDPNDVFYTPAHDSHRRPIRDEQTVNVFLLTLLSAITATTVPFSTRWLAERDAMTFKKTVQYVARTDGHLCNPRGPSFSIIEVKPRPRASDDVSIRVQESAQMAAWISHNEIKSHDPDKSCEIFLLSLDKDEIFVTFPHFTEAYGKNKNTTDLQPAHFLRMREYGPFRLDSKKDVKHIADFLHRYTLHKSKR